MANKIKTLPIKIEELIININYNYSNNGDIAVEKNNYIQKNDALTKVHNKAWTAICHSPISGTVKDIGQYPILQENILTRNRVNTTKSIVIKAKNINPKINDFIFKKNNLDNINSKKLASTLRQNGIIGLGGAGFPSADKINTTKIKTLIINAVECEPPISADNALILEHAADIIQGIIGLSKLLQVNNAVIALNKKMQNAYIKLQNAINDHRPKPDIKIKQVYGEYPYGFSKNIVKDICGIDMLQQEHLSQKGIVCFNVATIYAIRNALDKELPLTTRIVTVKTNLNNTTKLDNYLLPVGTPLITILSAFDIDIAKVYNIKYHLIIRVGGDYMGYDIVNTYKDNHKIKQQRYKDLAKLAITKETQSLSIEYYKIPSENKYSSLFRAVINKIKYYKKIYAGKVLECIRCNACENACPVNLAPQQLYWFSKKFSNTNNYRDLLDNNINNCIACGMCDSVCPSNIPLAKIFTHAKSNIFKNKERDRNAESAKIRFEQTNTRKQFKEQNKLEKSRVSLNSTKQHKQKLLSSALARAKAKKQQKTNCTDKI